MSGLEALAVISCLAAVVSAFKDGHAIVEGIQRKRKLRNASPPSKLLEESLAKAPLEVETKEEEGVVRYGEDFARGDAIAVDALKNILIDLQQSLLRHLRIAHEDDTFTDFTLLIDASDTSRIETVRTLYSLYMRIATKAPILKTPLAAFQLVASTGQFRNDFQEATGRCSEKHTVGCYHNMSAPTSRRNSLWRFGPIKTIDTAGGSAFIDYSGTSARQNSNQAKAVQRESRFPLFKRRPTNRVQEKGELLTCPLHEPSVPLTVQRNISNKSGNFHNTEAFPPSIAVSQLASSAGNSIDDEELKCNPWMEEALAKKDDGALLGYPLWTSDSISTISTSPRNKDSGIYEAASDLQEGQASDVVHPTTPWLGFWRMMLAPKTADLEEDCFQKRPSRCDHNTA